MWKLRGNCLQMAMHCLRAQACFPTDGRTLGLPRGRVPAPRLTPLPSLSSSLGRFRRTAVPIFGMAAPANGSIVSNGTGC